MDLNLTVLSGTLTDIRIVEGGEAYVARTVLEVLTVDHLGDEYRTDVYTSATDPEVWGLAVLWVSGQTRVWISARVETRNGETRLYADPTDITVKAAD